MCAAKKGDFFDELEGMTPEERGHYQTKGLQKALAHAYAHAPSAKAIFAQAGIKPTDIKTVKDLEKLPITRKGDLIELQRSRPPYGGFLAVPVAEVERVFITPGPIYGPHQTEEISWFGKTIYAAGFRKGDIVINTPTYHMSPAGLLFHEGVRVCKATVVPTGVGNTDAQIKTMLDLKVTGYTGMPSFLMTLIKRAEEMGHDFRRAFALKRAWFTGEMLGSALRKELEERYGIDTYQCYAVTDLGGCVAYECSEKAGMHFMDEYIIEIVDPDTGTQLGPGEQGEIVATPIHNPVWGLIRYGTGDISSYMIEPCPCGRTSYRISGIVGRTADAVKVRGMFVIAKQAEQVFSEFKQIAQFQLIVSRTGERDELVARVELTEVSIVDERRWE
jgi:phenylacetate-CoA ligase